MIAENVSNLSSQRLAGVGLAEQFNAFVKAAAVDDRILAIAGGEQDRDIGNSFPDFCASSGLRIGPGMTTSVKRRSICVPLSTIESALWASFALSTL
jgi:hypothetical protein